uniref:Uncharacterized protein n=1 Tax=Rhizophora mucronata TaxID=61149 RepID=A0A2P2JGY9_RHIMU
MGGDRAAPPSVTSGEPPSEDQDFSQVSSFAEPFFQPRDDIASCGKLESGIMNGKYESVLGGFEEVSCRISRSSLELEANQRRRRNVHREVLLIYDQLRSRSGSLMEAKNKILSYTPGQWIEKMGDLKLSDYDVPKTTTLLLIGPNGSGKSSLVNRISKVLEDDIFAPERAQVSCMCYSICCFAECLGSEVL